MPVPPIYDTQARILSWVQDAAQQRATRRRQFAENSNAQNRGTASPLFTATNTKGKATKKRRAMAENGDTAGDAANSNQPLRRGRSSGLPTTTEGLPLVNSGWGRGRSGLQDATGGVPQGSPGRGRGRCGLPTTTEGLPLVNSGRGRGRSGLPTTTGGVLQGNPGRGREGSGLQNTTGGPPQGVPGRGRDRSSALQTGTEGLLQGNTGWGRGTAEPNDSQDRSLFSRTQALNTGIPSLPPPPSTSSGTTRSRPSSPRKNSKWIGFSDKNDKIVMKDLEGFDPPVRQCNITMARAQYHIPEPAMELYSRLEETPHGAIPSELEVSRILCLFQKPAAKLTIDKKSYNADSDTPRKTRLPPATVDYIRSGQCPYPPEKLPALKERVHLTQEDADFNKMTGAHERQWGALVNRLLAEIQTWDDGRYFRIMNM